MDRREWDNGARLPRDGRARDAWSSDAAPDDAEPPRRASVADTGSLQPSPEAVAWARRADAWAEHPPDRPAPPPPGRAHESPPARAHESRPGRAHESPPAPGYEESGSPQAGPRWDAASQPAVRPAAGRPALGARSRWSGADAGGSTYEGEDAGWRTETAEWQAAEQGARWRHTTEWRSASGERGWRSTTEGWQAPEDGRGPEPPTGRRQTAISGTAWPTPPVDDPSAGREPATPPTYGTGPGEATARTAPWQSGGPGTYQANAPGTPATYRASPPGTPTTYQAGGIPYPWSAGPDHSGRRDPIGAPDRRDRVDAPRPPDAPGWTQGPDTPGWTDRADAAGWTDRADIPGDIPDERDQPGGLDWSDRGAGWQERTRATNWRDRTEAHGWPEPPNAPGWRDRTEASSWRPDANHHEPGTDWRDRSDSWRSEPDSGSWSRGEDMPDGWRQPGGQDGWHGPDGPNGWHGPDGPNGWHGPDDPQGGASGGRENRFAADPWRGRPRPPIDPWAQSAADSGVIPLSWEQPAADTGSWRTPSAAEPDSRGPNGAWPGDDHGAGDHLRPAEGQPGPNDAVTEIRQRIGPGTWRHAGPGAAGPDVAGPGVDRPGVTGLGFAGTGAPGPVRGPATYRTGDGVGWRRDLATHSELTEGESRRFGTQDFKPFHTSGPAAALNPPAPSYPAEAQAPGHPPVDRGGARRQNAPDRQWPPRRHGPPDSGPSIVGDLLEPRDGETEENNGGAVAAVGYTIIWYGVPVALFVVYVLVFASGDRAHALTTLADAAPQFALSLVFSIAIAVGLRWLIGSWRAVSIGLAAAVLGGGLATVLVSAITGHSLS